MADEVKFYLDPEDQMYDYTVEGDSNAIVLRNKRDLASIPNIIDVVEVSPVSAAESFVLKEIKAYFVIFASLLAAFFLLLVCARCIECCCGRRIDAWRRRRLLERQRRLRAEMLQQYSRRLARRRVSSLRQLACRSVIEHTKRPVKKNLRRLSLPVSLIDDLVVLRQYDRPLAVSHHRAQGV